MLVNLVDLFNFGRECERNKFNYKVGDFRKIDFLGRPWGVWGETEEYWEYRDSGVLVTASTISLPFCVEYLSSGFQRFRGDSNKLFNGSIVCVN